MLEPGAGMITLCRSAHPGSGQVLLAEPCNLAAALQLYSKIGQGSLEVSTSAAACRLGIQQASGLRCTTGAKCSTCL